MSWLSTPEQWIALLTLIALEIVLGVDNIIFISIIVQKVERSRQAALRRLGLMLAMVLRVALLMSLAWLAHLTVELFHVFDKSISARDLVLILGGLFLLAKSTLEIHEKLEHASSGEPAIKKTTFKKALIQILLLDLIFSLDSVITAVGMVSEVQLMITAVIISVLFMMAFSGAVSNFVAEHPTIKILALSFLTLVGVALIADGLQFHIPRGYIYFAMAFSVAVEMINIRIRKPTS